MTGNEADEIVSIPPKALTVFKLNDDIKSLPL